MILFRHTMSSRKSSRSLLKPVILSALFALSFASITQAKASSSDPEIKVAGQTVKFRSAPYVSEDGTLYAPLDFITAMGAKYQLSPDGKNVAIALANNRTSLFSCAQSDGQSFVPVQPIAEQLGGRYQWDDDNQTATILATILMVREDQDHLSVATSFPVAYKVDAVDKPSRVYIDVNGAWLGASPATVPVSGDDVASVRSNQISRDRVRVVVDLKKAMPFKVSSAAGSNLVDVALDPGVSRSVAPVPLVAVARGASAPVRLASNTNVGDGSDGSGSDSSSDSSDESNNGMSDPDSDSSDGSSLTRQNATQHITNIAYDASKPGILSVTVTVVGQSPEAAEPYKAFLLDSPDRLAFDLPGADVTLPSNMQQSTPDSMPLVNAMVKTIRWGVLKPDSPLVSRVVMDLYKPVSYTVATTDTAEGRKYVISIITTTTNVVPLTPPQIAVNPAVPPPHAIISQPETASPGDVLEGKTIVVDAGHGGHDSGAPGVNGLYEKNLTLPIAKYLRDELVACGVKVIMTRADDTFIPLPDRAQMGIDNHADIFVSIHCDSSGSQNSHEGSTVYYHANLLGCRNLASSIASRLGQLDDGIRDCGTRSDYVRFPGIGFSVLRHSPEPAVIVETGYVNSDKDANVLTNSNMQRLIAEGIVAGLKDFVVHDPSSHSISITRGSDGSGGILATTQAHVERNR